jgi:2-methylisocitrate lyase-like PEP mutase family enzyme
MASKTQRFRQLIEADEILIQPGIYDGFSARLVQQMGFKSAAISGAGLSETRLGWADVGLMGDEENLHASRAIAACVDIPVSADADTGYGNAINVHFTVRGFEQAGVDGIMLEDQIWPKRCGHMAGKEVISAEEGVEKIRAAVNMGFGIRSRPTTPLLSARELQDLGVAVVGYPRLVTSAAIQGMKNALSVLLQSAAEGRVIERPDLAVSFQELNELIGFGTIKDMEQRFLTAAQRQAKYGTAQ